MTFYLEKKALPVWIYARTRPRWDTPETIDQFGAAMICPAADTACRSKMYDVIGERTVARHAEVTIQPHWLGFSGDPRSFVIDIVLPQIRNQAAEEFLLRQRNTADYRDTPMTAQVRHQPRLRQSAGPGWASTAT